MIPIRTERLKLSELTDADAPFILELINEPGWIANIGDRGVRDLDGARRYIADGPAASYAANGFGMWRVDLAGAGEAIGICGLIRRDTLPAPDIGFAFLERWHGRGYATEAARAAMDHARNVAGLTRVLATVAPHNLASARVLEAAGFSDAGTILMPGQAAISRLFAWQA